jgi:hypothetical protein
MRGLGLMVAMDALDTARRAQQAADRRGTTVPRSEIGPDGLPVDRLDDGRSEARLAAWRAWARRGETDALPRAGNILPHPRRQTGSSVTSG